VRCFYPADHTQRPAEEFWHDHNLLQKCNHANAQDDTKDEDQDARSLILDKPQGRSKCRKTPVRQSFNVSEPVARVLYDSQTCTYRVSEMYDSHTRSALSTDDPHSARTIQKHPIFVHLVSGAQVGCTSHLLHQNDTRPNITKTLRPLWDDYGQ
jgi:hypothetical protein